MGVARPRLRGRSRRRGTNMFQHLLARVGVAALAAGVTLGTAGLANADPQGRGGGHHQGGGHHHGGSWGGGHYHGGGNFYRPSYGGYRLGYGNYGSGYSY